MRAWSPPEFSSTQAIRTASTGGEGGIRTLGTVSRTPVFKTGAFNHSATSPELLQFYYSPNCHAYFVPFGYTRILLSSPVFERAMASEAHRDADECTGWPRIRDHTYVLYLRFVHSATMRLRARSFVVFRSAPWNA